MHARRVALFYSYLYCTLYCKAGGPTVITLSCVKCVGFSVQHVQERMQVERSCTNSNSE